MGTQDGREHPEVYRLGNSITIYRNFEAHFKSIFDGFSDREFCGFNPPFPTESSGRTVDTALQVHTDRLINRTFSRSKYLFFTEGGMQRASRFFKRLHGTRHAHLLGKVEYAFAGNLSPEVFASVGKMSYFFGWCGTVPKCVIYLYDRSHDRPEGVVVHVDNQALLAVLKSHFDAHWERMEKEQAIGKFLDQVSPGGLTEDEAKVLVTLLEMCEGSGWSHYTDKVSYYSWTDISELCGWNRKQKPRSILDGLVKAEYVEARSLQVHTRYRPSAKGWRVGQQLKDGPRHP